MKLWLKTESDREKIAAILVENGYTVKGIIQKCDFVWQAKRGIEIIDQPEVIENETQD